MATQEPSPGQPSTEVCESPQELLTGMVFFLRTHCVGEREHVTNSDLRFAQPLEEALRSNPDGGEWIGELFVLGDVAYAEDARPICTRDEAIAIHKAQLRRDSDPSSP